MQTRKAQFYIILAVIIIVILAGLVTTVNYVSKKERPVKFYDLTENFENEVFEVIDYGVYSKENVEEQIENFTEIFLEYAKEKTPEIEIVYIYGNEGEAIVANYGYNEMGVITKRGNITVTGADKTIESGITLQIAEKKFKRRVEQKAGRFRDFIEKISNPERDICLNISNTLHCFELKGEQQFLAILRLEKEGEIYIKKAGEIS